MAEIEDRLDGKPTLEPLIPIPGILCEMHRNLETNEVYIKVEHTHWSVSNDLLTRNNNDLVHPIGIPRKIKF